MADYLARLLTVQHLGICISLKKARILGGGRGGGVDNVTGRIREKGWESKEKTSDLRCPWGVSGECSTVTQDITRKRHRLNGRAHV